MQIIGMKTTFVQLYCNVSILQQYGGGSGVICNVVLKLVQTIEHYWCNIIIFGQLEY